jgi:hypothetical protein
MFTTTPIPSKASGSLTFEMINLRVSSTKWYSLSPASSYSATVVQPGESVHLYSFEYYMLNEACSPGRFFAVNEVKAMLAYILINYDFRLADGAKETPPPHWFGGGRSPNAFAKVEFRKRQKA